jgi:hypothetical protein
MLFPIYMYICIQVGNVYAQFREEEEAAAALQGMTGRFYAGRWAFSYSHISNVVSIADQWSFSYSFGMHRASHHCRLLASHRLQRGDLQAI